MKVHPRILVPLAAIVAAALTLGCKRIPTTSASPGAAHVPLELIYNAEEQGTEKSAVAQAVQATLADTGIVVTLIPVSSAIYNDRIAKGAFEAALSLWWLDYEDGEGYLTDFYSKSSYRMSRYRSPQFDQTYLTGLFAESTAAKVSAFKAAASIIDRARVWVPLYSTSDVFLMRPEASGFASTSCETFDYRSVGLDAVHASTDVEVQTFDPALVYDLGSKHVVSQSYEGLIAMDDKGNIVPSLATDWQFSPKMDEVVFHLRRNVAFHGGFAKGRTMTASDVVASYQRVIKSSSPYGYLFDHVVGVDDFKAGKAKTVSGFVAPDPMTFKIRLHRPFPSMLSWLLPPAAFVLPAGLPEKFDFTKGSVGTGAFVLDSWDGATAHFSANRTYWSKLTNGRALPLPKSLGIRVVKDPTAALGALKSGELDVLNVPLALLPTVLTPDGTLTAPWARFQLRLRPLNNLKLIAFNMERAPWGKDEALRRRLSDSIDREGLVRGLFRGTARTALSIIPTGVPGF